MNLFLKIKDFDDKEKIIDNLNQLNKYSFCKGHLRAYGQMVWNDYNKAVDEKHFGESTTETL